MRIVHHLPHSEKENTLREVHRVLRPGGSFHMMDFAGSHDHHGILNHLFHASERLSDNDESAVLQLLRNSGFSSAQKTHVGRLIFGPVAYYQAWVLVA
jgi:SAM-dependent methyltransferase